MPFSPPDQKFCDDFFAAIAPIEKGFQYIGFSYLAVRLGALSVLLRGRVFLNTSAPTALTGHFQSKCVRAGHYRLTDLGLSVRDLISKLLTGTLDAPAGELSFPSASGGRHAASYVPFHPDGLQSQLRFNVLTIIGGQTETIRQPDIDWEIKAASPPYEGLQELANEFGLGVLSEGPISVDVVARNVAVIDGQDSKVVGSNAGVHILLAKGLSQERVNLGYRIYVPGEITKRGIISGTMMQWTEEAGHDRGIVALQTTSAAVLNCAVTYDGVTQSHLWLSDPDRAQNPRRAVYEAFDPKMEILKSIVGAAQNRGQVARDLEAAVAWLLWMLGFSVAHLGGTPRTRDAADLIVTTPSGHFAVVECTTGLLKAENKLALLHQRAENVRAALAASNNAFVRVLPVMVTSKTMNEVVPDIEAAEKLGVLVITREGLDRATVQTLRLPNADQIYTEAEQTVSTALAKYKAQATVAPNDNFRIPT
jgi:hypothetical protein